MRALTELFNRKFYNLIVNLSVCTIEGLTRRQTFKTAAAATAGGALLTTTGSQPVKANQPMSDAMLIPNTVPLRSQMTATTGRF